MASAPIEIPVPETLPTPKKKGRTMTPELLEKLSLARERAKELREQAKKVKETLNDTDIPEPEKTKTAKYLATRNAIKEKIKKEIENEIADQWEPEQSVPPPPPKLPRPSKLKNTTLGPVESDESDDEYTVIRVPKKKIIKWNKREKSIDQIKPPEPEKTVYGANWANPYNTQHLVNLARSGYRF
jgi:hypothetical protein